MRVFKSQNGEKQHFQWPKIEQFKVTINSFPTEFNRFVTFFSLFVQHFWCYHHWKELLLGILEFIAVFSQRTANLLKLRDNMFTWPWVKLDLCLLTMLHYWEEIKGNLLPQRLLAFFSNLTMLQYWEEIKGKWFTSLSPYYSLSSE